jgi:hypothetical protein
MSRAPVIGQPVMPGARLQAYGVLKRHCPHACRSCYLNRYPSGLERLLEKVHLQLVTGAGKPQHQARVPGAGRFDKPHAIACALEGKPYCSKTGKPSSSTRK